MAKTEALVCFFLSSFKEYKDGTTEQKEPIMRLLKQNHQHSLANYGIKLVINIFLNRNYITTLLYKSVNSKV